jgi:hypothetical protein
MNNTPLRWIGYDTLKLIVTVVLLIILIWQLL